MTLAEAILLILLVLFALPVIIFAVGTLWLAIRARNEMHALAERRCPVCNQPLGRETVQQAMEFEQTAAQADEPLATPNATIAESSWLLIHCPGCHSNLLYDRDARAWRGAEHPHRFYPGEG